jgi:CBS-domain-containing membrane protein
MTSLLVPLGILLPESLLRSQGFAILAAFVAVNTVMYVALALAKVMPKLYPREWLPRRYARAETRSIHPDGPR